MSKKLSVRKPSHCIAVVITVLLLYVCFTNYIDVTSKLCFARGYNHYLNNRDVDALNYYLKSLSIDHQFIKPIKELVIIYKENSQDPFLLNQIEDRADFIDNEELYETIATALEGIGNFSKSLEYYEKARKQNHCISCDIGVIRNLIALNEIDQAERELTKVVSHEIEINYREELLFLGSQIDFQKGRYVQAELKIDQLLKQDVIDPKYHVHMAKIQNKLGNTSAALKLLSYAIAIKKELPDAYFEISKIYYTKKDLINARESLKKTLYFDNHNSFAYLMLCMTLSKKWTPIETLKRDPNVKSSINNENNELRVSKGDAFNLTTTFNNVPVTKRFQLGILEPYGFGLKTKLIRTNKSINSNGTLNLSAVCNVEALRPIRANMNHPWTLNIVLVDIDTGTYTDQKANITVNEKQDEEGRILFVITEDHEQTSDYSHMNGDKHEIDPNEIDIDLIQKGIFADDIANKYKVKWSHIIDIGSSITRLQWIQNGNHGGQWDNVWDNMASYLSKTIKMGHDVQLHIHAYSIPGNKLFRQYFDPDKNRILFKDNIVRMKIPEGTHGAWADNFTEFGDFSDPDSRVGSIFAGIKLLESALHKTDSSYRTIFFRAGEYEFGKDKKSVAKSILALKKNNILCGSDAYAGRSPFTQDFRFFKKAGKNVYFSKNENIQERANSLFDVGILQILPVPQINAHDYVKPIDHGKHIKYNYDLCLSNGKIKNDIFILMEMEHLNTMNWKYQWDQLSDNYQDWGRMKDHFKYINEHCPKLEYVTISEAITAYLDYYTTDVVAIRTNENKVKEDIFEYDIKFLGKDIEVSDSRPHFVSIKPPSYFLGKIVKVELTFNNVVKKTWTPIMDYRDLDFKIISKTGYKIKVYIS